MVLIDFNNLTVASFFAALKDSQGLNSKGLNSQGIPSFELIRRRVIKRIQSLKQFQDHFGDIIIACDGKRPYWRHKIFKHYKMNRKSGKYSTEAGNITHELRREFEKHLPYPLLRIPHIECDDIIALLVRKTKSPHLIYSKDSDFYQLLDSDKDIVQFIPGDENIIRLTREEAKDSLIEKIVRGDKGDGLPNIKSDSNTFVRDEKRQTPIYKTELFELYKKGKSDSKLKRRYKQNRAIVDLRRIPKEIELQVKTAYYNKKHLNNKKTWSKYLNYIGDNHLLPTHSL